MFVTPDEYHLLRVRATVARLRALLRRRRMGIADAFRAFDHDSDGFLTSEELFGFVFSKVGRLLFVSAD